MANYGNAQTPPELQKAFDAIRRFNDELPDYPADCPDIRENFRRAKAFFVLEKNGETLFGFSNIVGCGMSYVPQGGVSLTRYYRNNYKSIKLNTYEILKKWYTKVPNPSSEYTVLFGKLKAWAELNNLPLRTGDEIPEIIVLRPECQHLC